MARRGWRAFRQQSTAITLEMSDPDGMRKPYAEIDPERTMRIELAKGQKWPDAMKRGKSVEIDLNIGDGKQVFAGRVRFRRLHVAVVDGSIR